MRDVPCYIDKSDNFCHKRYMPRRSRIDAPGALHHIIVRGIERKTIFKDDADRDNFLNENGVKSTIDPWKIKCYMLQHVTST